MTDDPFLPILNRHAAIVNAQHHGEQLSLLEDLVNYGSSLLARAFHSSEKSLTDAMILFHLAREVVVQVDSLHVLMTNGCSAGSKSVCRSLLEKAHLTLWTLKDDSEEKMKHLFVGGLRSARIGSLTILPGHKEHEALGEQKRKALLDTQLPELAVKELKSINDRLAWPDVVAINASFDAMAQSIKHEPSWTKVYCISRPKLGHKGTARGIAKELGKLDEYQVYYTNFSSSTHGQDFLSSLVLKHEDVDVKNIRDGSAFVSNFHLAMNSSIELYKALLDRYRPGEVENFGRKYVKDWMSRRLR